MTTIEPTTFDKAAEFFTFEDARQHMVDNVRGFPNARVTLLKAGDFASRRYGIELIPGRDCWLPQPITKHPLNPSARPRPRSGRCVRCGYSNSTGPACKLDPCICHTAGGPCSEDRP